MFPILICFSILVIFLVLILLARYQEKKDWNNGKCNCGSNWEYFDTDSQGGRGYLCRKCGKFIWISYSVDKNYGK